MHGGFRSGAGRKKGFSAVSAEEARKYVSKRVSEELESLVDILINKAKEGDLKATNILFNRAWGRSCQEIQVQQEWVQTEPSEEILRLAELLNS